VSVFLPNAFFFDEITGFPLGALAVPATMILNPLALFCLSIFFAGSSDVFPRGVAEHLAFSPPPPPLRIFQKEQFFFPCFEFFFPISPKAELKT